MKKYAKIINKDTKQCDVGLGTDSNYYESVGMEEMDVEQSYNGQWYLKGYVPEKPKGIIDADRIHELQTYLNETDWYVTRLTETGVVIPDEVKEKRQTAREEISKLKNK